MKQKPDFKRFPVGAGFMKRIWLPVLWALCFGAVEARAQIMSNPAQWYINNQIYSTRVFNGVVAGSMFRKNTPTTRQNRSPQANKSAAADTMFKAAPESILPKIWAEKSGANRRETGQILDSFVRLYRQTAQKDGFPANDLAYAFEYFVVNNYQLYHDLIELPPDKDPRAKRAKDGFERIQILNQKKLLQVTPSQERAIFNQFREVLAANPEIRKMSDAQKQEAAELLAIMFGINFAVYMQGVNEGDEKLTAEARALAKVGLEKLLGAPVGRIKITNGGLEF